MSRLDTCRLCPRLCRDGCPVATVSETGTPTFLATVLEANERGILDDAITADAVTRCTDCGACQDHCHLHRPLPEWLREARARLLPAPAVDPIGEVRGDGPVYVQTDERVPLAALQARLGGAFAVLRTSDRLGAHALEHRGLEVHLAQIRVRLSERRVIVADGGVGEVLTAARVPFQWLWDLVSDEVGVASCCTPGSRPFPCCGARGPLPVHHPTLARLVAARFVERAGTQVRDARCRSHLVASGFDATDTLDRMAP